MHAAPGSRASPLDRRRRRLLITIATALVIATAFVLHSLPSSQLVLSTSQVMMGDTYSATASARLRVTPRTRLVLSTSKVKVGDTYSATASGFSPREGVRFSWTGPTNGLMGVVPADLGGSATSGGILEKDPPGNYSIIVTGLTSGRTASAELQIIPGN